MLGNKSIGIDMSKRKLETGKDTVVIGDVSGKIGDGSVVIGATDERGNTIINQPMAIGRGAKAGPGTIAIGAGAGAGSDIFHLIYQLKKLPEVKKDRTLVSIIESFHDELKKPESQQDTVKSLWSVIQTSATVSGAATLVQQIGRMLGL